MSTSVRLFLIVWIIGFMGGFLLYGWAIWPLSGSLPPDEALIRLESRTNVLGLFKYFALAATLAMLWRVAAVRDGKSVVRLALMAAPGFLFLTLGYLQWMRLSRQYNTFAEANLITIKPVGGTLLFLVALAVAGGATYLAYTRLRPSTRA